MDRYRLRNGIVAEKIASDEAEDTMFPGESKNYPQNGWYRVVTSDVERYEVGKCFCLGTNQSSDPLEHTGDTHGTEFDVIEEVHEDEGGQDEERVQ